MLETQMLLVGLPSWTTCGPSSHIRAFLFLSDSGPDEVEGDKLIRAELNDVPSSTHSRQWCLEHIVHLIAGGRFAKALRLLGGVGNLRECVQVGVFLIDASSSSHA